MFAALFVRFLIVLVRCLPTIWVGWTAKTFVSWYYPASKLGAANPGSTVLNWVLWTGVAFLVLMIGGPALLIALDRRERANGAALDEE